MTTTRSPQIDLDERTVGEVMRLGVVTCAPDTPLSEVAHLMSACHIHSVVVGGLTEDEHGRGSSGASSPTSTWRAPSLRSTGEGASDRGDGAVTASPFDTLAEVAKAMADHEVAHLIVVDGERACSPTAGRASTTFAAVDFGADRGEWRGNEPPPEGASADVR